MSKHPIVWTIAGSDSGGGAGIQTDLNTFHDFKVHGCTVITALTAQNSKGVTHIQATSHENLNAQLAALKEDMTPLAIKLGMLYHPSSVQSIASHLQSMQAPIIADPVMVSTHGDTLTSQDFISQYQHYIFPIASLLTPNIHEAAILTGMSIQSYADMEKAASLLLEQGVKAVLIKGGDLNEGELSSDYFCDNTQSWWINQNRIHTLHTHGTGCTLSSAIAAGMAQGWSLTDAIVLAKAYVHAGLSHPILIGSGRHPVGHVDLHHLSAHFPWISEQPQALPKPFKKITKPMGRYPVVDNLRDLEILCCKGISIIQLRIKNNEQATEEIFKEALAITQSYGVTLCVNDYIDIAKKIQAPALHLGQEDIRGAAIATLDRDNIMLGISAHHLVELAIAYAHHPSYLTQGPVFATTSKQMDYALIGMKKLAFIATLSPLPLVAIGGITVEQTQSVLNIGCSGVAFISASKQLMREGRYDRHLTLPQFSVSKQKRLLNAKIVCVGVGGLAAGFLPYLAAAGVGRLTLIDADTIMYSNLQRQILFREKDIGLQKTDMAARYLTDINSNITVLSQGVKLTEANALALLQDHDLIIDGTDNFDAHYLINDTARRLQTPLVAAAVFQEKGHLFYLSPQSGCYRCAFPTADRRPDCQVAGILGTMPALLGVMQAQIAVQALTGHESSSFCRSIDMASGQMKTLMIKQDERCGCCVKELQPI